MLQAFEQITLIVAVILIGPQVLIIIAAIFVCFCFWLSEAVSKLGKSIASHERNKVR